MSPPTLVHCNLEPSVSCWRHSPRDNCDHLIRTWADQIFSHLGRSYPMSPITWKTSSWLKASMLPHQNMWESTMEGLDSPKCRLPLEKRKAHWTNVNVATQATCEVGILNKEANISSEGAQLQPFCWFYQLWIFGLWFQGFRVQLLHNFIIH